MLFTEPTFLFGFLPVLLAIYYMAPARARNALLVVASVIFYARDGGAFTWIILGSILVNTTAAIWVERLGRTRQARLLLAGIVGLNLLSLITFKYAGFLVQNVNAGLTSIGAGTFAVPSLLLPIGISFFTFHSISYIVDVYRRQAVAQKGPIGAALYLLFFPQLIAGPIIRYHDIAAQITGRVHTTAQFALGVRRFSIGLAKKLLIASIVARPVDAIFAMPADELTAAHAWLAIAGYTLQIYFDFSGYSDMAIGLGHMFGFTFPENFRYPYIASSVQEFWKRWHISLSTWFRDYLYIPLGGNRRSPGRVYLNLATVFFLCGLWHGAAWTFVVWGLLHGLFLVLERIGLGDLLERVPKPVGWVYTLAMVMTGWVFFRADSIASALAMLRALVGFGTGAPTPYAASWYLTPELVLAMVAGIIGSMPIVPLLSRAASQPSPGEGHARWYPAWEAGAVLAVVLLLAVSITQVALGAFTPFIYFRF
ncbi:MAG TPA: MBOAT family protein [Vicinamibacterales bacterium]|nr:MBOAT family protein [Vicinamibacterales bacterium]